MVVGTASAPSTAPSDEALLDRSAAGDRRALEELFRRYRQPAYRVAHRLLGNEADALDAVQDGFVKVLTHLSAFQGRSSFKTWLLRVVSNAALDLGRQRGRRMAAEPPAAFADGELDAAARARVEAWLAANPSARPDLEAQRRLSRRNRRFWRAAAAPNPGEANWVRVLGHVQDALDTPRPIIPLAPP